MKLVRKYITPYVKKYAASFFLAILFATLTIAASTMLTFTSGYLIVKASLRPETILLLYVPIVGVRAFGISRASFQYFERLSGHNAVLKVLSSMREQLYRIIEPQALWIHNRFKTGDLLGTLADDIEHLQDVYIRTIFPTVSGLTIFFVATSVITVFDWKFALLIGVLIGIIVFVYPLLSLYYLKKIQVEQKSWTKTLYENLTDALFGLEDWLISGEKRTFINRFLAAQRNSDELERKMNHFHHSRTFVLQSLAGVVMVLMAIWSSLQATDGVFEPSYIAAFTLAVIPLVEGLTPISQAAERIPTYEESLLRLEEIERFAGERKSKPSVFPGEKKDLGFFGSIEEDLAFSRFREGQGTPEFSDGKVQESCRKSFVGSMEKQVSDVPTTVDPSRIQSHQENRFSDASDTTVFQTVAAAIEIDNVSFRYPEQEQLAIDGISISIAPGDKVAILGKSGAGKSTLIQLLMGELVPESGSISIAGFAPQAYGEQIYELLGILNQKPYLFATSVENNIRLGTSRATKADVERVVEQVKLDRYIRSLPLGLKTFMGESGNRFSGGERQRIALARVLLKDTPIVILDEPTIGLDPKTEWDIIEAIFAALKEKTVIWITHHLAGMEKMDQIIFLDEGKITMQGSHEHLLQTNPHYQALYQMDKGI